MDDICRLLKRLGNIHSHLQLSWGSSLCRDDDNAIPSPQAIDCLRGRILKNADRFNFLGSDSVEQVVRIRIVENPVNDDGRAAAMMSVKTADKHAQALSCRLEAVFNRCEPGQDARERSLKPGHERLSESFRVYRRNCVRNDFPILRDISHINFFCEIMGIVFKHDV